MYRISISRRLLACSVLIWLFYCSRDSRAFLIAPPTRLGVNSWRECGHMSREAEKMKSKSNGKSIVRAAENRRVVMRLSRLSSQANTQLLSSHSNRHLSLTAGLRLADGKLKFLYCAFSLPSAICEICLHNNALGSLKLCRNFNKFPTIVDCWTGKSFHLNRTYRNSRANWPKRKRRFLHVRKLLAASTIGKFSIKNNYAILDNSIDTKKIHAKSSESRAFKREINNPAQRNSIVEIFEFFSYPADDCRRPSISTLKQHSRAAQLWTYSIGTWIRRRKKEENCCSFLLCVEALRCCWASMDCRWCNH